MKKYKIKSLVGFYKESLNDEIQYYVRKGWEQEEAIRFSNGKYRVIIRRVE